MAGIVPDLAPAAAASGGYAVTSVPIGGQARSVAADPATDTIYAASGADAVAVINGATNEVTTIGLTFEPMVVVADPASDRVYALGLSQAAVINGAKNQVLTTFSLPPNTRSLGAAVDPVTGMIYVADYSHSAVDVINEATDSVATIPVGGIVRGVAVDPANDTIYASNVTGDEVAVIDGQTNKVTGNVPLPAGADPAGLAVDPGAGLVYVADQAGEVSVINVATDQAATLVSGLTQPLGLALDPSAGRLYATVRDGTVPGGVANLGDTYVIDTTSKTVLEEIPRGGTSVAMGSGGSVYVTNGYVAGPLEDSVEIITPSAANTMSPVIVSSTILTLAVGQDVSATLLASAIPAAGFSATGLPAGLTLSRSGVLSGTPAAGTEGEQVASVTAANGIAPADTEPLYLFIDQAPSITSPGNATFTTGTEGSFTVTASGYPASAFTETGVLPGGVTLSPAGVLSGSPAYGSGGIYHLVLSAANGIGSPATQDFTLTVDQPPAFSARRRHIAFRAGHWRKFIFRTRGFPVARLTRSGRLPRGIRFRVEADGAAKLSGRAARSARGHVYRVVIRARNGVGTTARLVLFIRVR